MTHLALLQKGIESWNQWRSRHPNTACDLENQDLSHGYFFEGNFSGANLRNANLQRACLVGANFQGADLSGADFRGAYLADANFYGANLSYANLSNTDLDRADMREATLLGTQMADVDLRQTKLPSATDSQYSHQVAALLAQPPSSSSIKLETHSEEVCAKERRSVASVEEKQLLALWTAVTLSLFRRPKPDAIADRQQRIRLSAIPVHKKTSLSTAINSGRAITRSDSYYSQRTTRKWGRRRADQSLPSRFRRLLSRRVIWAPVVLSVVGLLAASRWSTVTGKTASFDSDSGVSHSAITSEVTSLALVKSLTGENQIWSIATQDLDDGTTRVLTGESNGEIQIWDGKTGKTIRRLSGHRFGVESLVISRSGRWLVSSDSRELRVWNLVSGQLMHTIPVAVAATEDSFWVGRVSATVAIAPDERTFISSFPSSTASGAVPGEITVWDMVTGAERYRLETGSEVLSLAITPDSRSFVSGGQDHAVRQWDVATGRLLQEFLDHWEAVHAIAISPDGQTLASGSQDQTIKLWDLATGDLETTLSGHTGQVFSLAISPDGKTLASSSHDRTLRLWDLSRRELTRTIDNDAESITSVAFATNGLSRSALGATSVLPTLISGGGDKTVNIWQ